MVTGHGAGFVMCWQNDVRLTLAEDEDPRNFMVVKSGSYVLAIPDLGHYARHEVDVDNSRPETSSSLSSRRELAVFKKTVMKLNGNVRWGVGLVFERNLDSGGRSFDFIPHYKIALKNPKYAKPSNGKVRLLSMLNVPKLTKSGLRRLPWLPQSPHSHVDRHRCALRSGMVSCESRRIEDLQQCPPHASILHPLLQLVVNVLRCYVFACTTRQAVARR